MEAVAGIEGLIYFGSQEASTDGVLALCVLDMIQTMSDLNMAAGMPNHAKAHGCMLLAHETLIAKQV